MTKRKVLQLVRSRLKDVGHGIGFDIVEDGVRREETWWYVPVSATRRGKDVPRQITVNIYANVEDELEQKHDLSVLFIPVGHEELVSA